MKRAKFLILTTLLYLLPPTFRLINALRRGIPLTAPLDSLESLLTANFVGKSSDTFLYYLPPAYSILKYGEPIRVVGDRIYHLCYRVVQSYVFLPFMAMFGGYFPIYYIFTFSLLFGLLLGLLLLELNPDRYALNSLLSALILPVAFYYLPFLMLEAPTSVLLLAYAIFLVRYVKRRSVVDALLSLPFLMGAVFLRPETVLLALPLLYLTFRRRLLFVLSLLSLSVPVAVHVGHAVRCGDQSNFYLWAYALHVERERGEPYTDVADLIRDAGEDLQRCLRERGVEDPSVLGFGDRKLNLYFQMFQTNGREYSACFRRLLFQSVGVGDVWTTVKRVPMNLLSLLVPSFASSPFYRKVGLLKWPFKALFGVYGVLIIFAIMCSWACGGAGYRWVVASYLLLLIIYALYNPFGGFDALRFKMYLLPFEAVFLGLTLRAFISPHSTE